MKTGDIIKTARKAKRMTQGALAQLVGVSTQAVSQWERGETRPNIFTAVRLALVLDLERDWLLQDDAIESIGGKLPQSRYAQEYKGLVPVIELDESTYFRRNLNFSKTLLPKAQSLIAPTIKLEGYGFAITVADTLYMPTFQPGDILIFDCNLWPDDGDFVTSQITELPAHRSVIGKFYFNGDDPFAYIEPPGAEEAEQVGEYCSTGVHATLVETRRLRRPRKDDLVFAAPRRKSRAT